MAIPHGGYASGSGAVYPSTLDPVPVLASDTGYLAERQGQASIQDRLANLAEQADMITLMLMAVLGEPVLPTQNSIVTGSVHAGAPPAPGCSVHLDRLAGTINRLGEYAHRVQSCVGRL